MRNPIIHGLGRIEKSFRPLPLSPAAASIVGSALVRPCLGRSVVDAAERAAIEEQRSFHSMSPLQQVCVCVCVCVRARVFGCMFGCGVA